MFQWPPIPVPPNMTWTDDLNIDTTLNDTNIFISVMGDLRTGLVAEIQTWSSCNLWTSDMSKLLFIATDRVLALLLLAKFQLSQLYLHVQMTVCVLSCIIYPLLVLTCCNPLQCTVRLLVLFCAETIVISSLTVCIWLWQSFASVSSNRLTNLGT